MQRRRAGGFNLIELVTVIVVIGILITLLFPAYSSFKARAQRVQCMANLRTLYTAADLFVQQNGSWPQIPAPLSDTGEQDYATAWTGALAPFGATQKSWICPTIQDLLHNPDLSKPENLRVDYIATSFSDKPMASHQWPRQPWFAEAGDVHGNGNLIIFTDGSIADLNTIAKATKTGKNPKP